MRALSEAGGMQLFQTHTLNSNSKLTARIREDSRAWTFSSLQQCPFGERPPRRNFNADAPEFVPSGAFAPVPRGEYPTPPSLPACAGL